MTSRPAEELTFESEERHLLGRVFRPGHREPSGAGILFVHGWESSQSSYQPRAERLSAQLGITCLTFDLSGHGKSGGRLSTLSPRNHLADTIAAFDVLATTDSVNPLKIGICGASYGAYLAALAIANRTTRALLLRAPALHPDSALDITGNSQRTQPEALEDAAPLRNLAAFDGPVLIVESEHDEVISHEVIETYLAASHQARHALIPGAAHAMTERKWNEAFIDLLLGWADAL